MSSTEQSANDVPSDNEADYSREYNGNVGSEESWDDRVDKKEETILEAALGKDTPGDSTPSTGEEDGMLARDIQRKTAYYDYAAEKQMSQADAKLFYQRSQLDAVKSEGSNYGSAHSPSGSPVLRARTFSNIPNMGMDPGLRRSGSIMSMQSGQSHQKLVISRLHTTQVFSNPTQANSAHPILPDLRILKRRQKTVLFKTQ